MITQRILPFKLEQSDARLTARGGLALFAEVVRALKVEEKIGEVFPRPGSNRGYEAWSYIEPVLLMLAGGGSHVEDLREIRDDSTLRSLVGLERMPSLSTYGDWLVRRGERGGVAAMRKADEQIACSIVKRMGVPDYTLDVDATIIKAEKEEAEMTYKGMPGYQPQLGFLAEIGVCLSQEFRQGNVPAQSDAVRFIKRCRRLCPTIKRLRSDSAFYQAAVVNWCEEEGVRFTITADQDAAVKEVIGTIADWQPLVTEKGETTDREVGTAVHAMKGTNESFRLVVQRYRPEQPDLFAPDAWFYYAIATNRDEMSASEIVRFHNRRGQVENAIKELKIGFGMERMTSGDFRANGLWFGLGVLAYNLVQAQKLLFLGPEWKTKTIATLRWQLFQVAGRLVRRGRQWILRLATSSEKFSLLLAMRLRIAAFA